jgi:hypothetical protein
MKVAAVMDVVTVDGACGVGNQVRTRGLSGGAEGTKIYEKYQ